MNHDYDHIISIKNLCDAWLEFICGKKKKKDVAEFSFNLLQNIFDLHESLKNKTYRHGHYEAFSINDPKPRSIHKATVRDRILHHAIYRSLYHLFDRKFIYDSYSCRYYKGTHLALNRFHKFAQQVSRSNKQTCWVLKCDIRKFFASIDQQILIGSVKKYILDPNTKWLIERVVESFSSTDNGKGLPLGNLTSQLLVNVYMNEFDQFMKHKVKAKYYIRYADDFVIMSKDRKWLEEVLFKIKEFLRTKLKLELHPNKVSIETLSSGIDFLGWVNFPDHRVMRTTTKKRMFRNNKLNRGKPEVVQSYLGLLSHGNGMKLQKVISSQSKLVE